MHYRIRGRFGATKLHFLTDKLSKQIMKIFKSNPSSLLGETSWPIKMKKVNVTT